MIKNNGIYYGIFTGIALILYFLLMKLLGLEHIFELRMFNFVIMGVGVYFALRLRYFILHEKVGYLRGLMTGLRTGFTALFIFVIFMSVYVMVFDRNILEIMEVKGAWGSAGTIYELAGIVVIEGAAGVFILAFMNMQYFKRYIASVENRNEG